MFGKTLGDTVYLRKRDRKKRLEDGDYYIVKVTSKWFFISKDENDTINSIKVEKHLRYGGFYYTEVTLDGSDAVFESKAAYLTSKNK